MTNNYRVDRAMEGLSPPCGMNSIRYIGDNYVAAMHVFNHLEGGKDAWNQPDKDYGVMLSMWDSNRNDYVVKRWKSYQGVNYEVRSRR